VQLSFSDVGAAGGVLNVYVTGLGSGGFSAYLHSQIAKHNESLMERQMINVIN